MRDEYVTAKNNLTDKVNSINTHIDNLIKTAPEKLTIKLSVTDADKEELQNRQNAHYEEVKQAETEHYNNIDTLLCSYHQKNIVQVNSWGKNVRETFRNYEGYCATGWVANVCAFFFIVGLLCTVGLIGYCIAQVCK